MTPARQTAAGTPCLDGHHTVAVACLLPSPEQSPIPCPKVRGPAHPRSARCHAGPAVCTHHCRPVPPADPGGRPHGRPDAGEARPRQQDDTVPAAAPDGAARASRTPRRAVREEEAATGGGQGEEGERRAGRTAGAHGGAARGDGRAVAGAAAVHPERAPAALRGRWTGNPDRPGRQFDGPPSGCPIGPTGGSYIQNGSFALFEREQRSRPQDPAASHRPIRIPVYLLDVGRRPLADEQLHGGLDDVDAPAGRDGHDERRLRVAFGRTPQRPLPWARAIRSTSSTPAGRWSEVDRRRHDVGGLEVDLGDVFSVRDIAVDASDPVNDIVMVATDFGFYRSIDGGATLSADPERSGRALPGQVDAGASPRPARAGWPPAQINAPRP